MGSPNDSFVGVGSSNHRIRKFPVSQMSAPRLRSFLILRTRLNVSFFISSPSIHSFSLLAGAELVRTRAAIIKVVLGIKPTLFSIRARKFPLTIFIPDPTLLFCERLMRFPDCRIAFHPPPPRERSSSFKACQISA